MGAMMGQIRQKASPSSTAIVSSARAAAAAVRGWVHA